MINSYLFQAVTNTLEVVADHEERSALAEGLRAVSEGNTKPLSEIRAALKKGEIEIQPWRQNTSSG